MSTKFLKQLSFDEAKTLLFQNDEIKAFIKEEDWDKNKINGIKFVKIVEGNALILKKTKTSLNLDDKKMECLVQYLKANYPEANFTGGLPDVPAKPTSMKPAAPTRPISMRIPASK